MSSVKKIFFFPDPALDRVREDLGPFQGTVNYVGILGAERTTLPYLDTPLDATIATQLIKSLNAPNTEYVVLLKHDHHPKEMVTYLQAREMAFAAKQEVTTYPSSVIYLAALGKKVKSTTYHLIYRTSALDDVRWTIQNYGSLDRVRVFIARSEAAAQIAERLARPNAEIDYNALLDLCEYHALFDYDWEYFFVMTRKPHVDHLVSWLRRACHELGIETDTRTEAKAMMNLRGRLERLTGVSLFRPATPAPSATAG